MAWLIFNWRPLRPCPVKSAWLGNPCGEVAKPFSMQRDFGSPYKMLGSTNEPRQTDISRARPRSRPLHGGRVAACRAGLREARPEIHADPPSGAEGAIVQPPAARRV